MTANYLFEALKKVRAISMDNHTLDNRLTRIEAEALMTEIHRLVEVDQKELERMKRNEEFNA